MKTIENTPAAKATTKPIVRSAPKPPTRKPIKTTVEISKSILIEAVKIARGTGETFDQLVARAIVHLQKVTDERTATVSIESAAGEPKSVTTDLDRHSREMGIPVSDLRRICLRAGLDQLNLEEVKMKALNDLLPIYFPAAEVRVLREVCEAGGKETGDEFARSMIANLIEDTLRSDTGRASHLAYGILDAQSDFDDEGMPIPDLDALARMQSAVDRLNANNGGAA